MKYIITTCCKDKRLDEALLPSIDRYLDPRIKKVFNIAKKSGDGFLILSGKYGILKPEDPIPYYDQILLEENVPEIVDLVVPRFRELRVAEIIVYGKDASLDLGWIPYYSVLKKSCEKLGIVYSEVILNEPFVPHWFKYININNLPDHEILSGSGFKLFDQNKDSDSPDKVAFFLDGLFYPTATGQSYHIMNLMNAMRKSDSNAYLFRCYRGGEPLEVYKTFKFNTICISPDIYYDDLGAVSELLAKNHITTVVFDTSEVILLQGAHFKKYLGTKVIYDVPNVDPVVSKLLGLDESTIKAQEIEIVQADEFVDVYWVKTEIDAKQLIDFGITENKVRVRGIGIDTNRFKYRLREKLTKPVRAVYLGNMSYPPNAGGLNILQTTSCACDIDVIGDGDIKTLSTAYPNLNFLGKLDDLESALDKYDLAFACPSFGSGMSLKILDYFASGIPIISNSVGIRGYSSEINEVAIVDDSKDLSSSVNRLIKNPALYKKLSGRGRKYTENYFNINKNINLFVSDILELG